MSRVNEMSRGTLQSTSKISFIRLTQLNLREFFHTIVLEIRQRLYMMACFDSNARLDGTLFAFVI